MEIEPYDVFIMNKELYVSYKFKPNKSTMDDIESFLEMEQTEAGTIYDIIKHKEYFVALCGVGGNEVTFKHIKEEVLYFQMGFEDFMEPDIN